MYLESCAYIYEIGGGLILASAYLLVLNFRVVTKEDLNSCQIRLFSTGLGK